MSKNTKTTVRSMKTLDKVTGIEVPKPVVKEDAVVGIDSILAKVQQTATSLIEEAQIVAAETEALVQKRHPAYLARDAFQQALRQAYAGGFPAYRALKDEYDALKNEIDSGKESNGVKIPRTPNQSPMRVQLSVLLSKITDVESFIDKVVCEEYNITPSERDAILEKERLGFEQQAKEWEQKHNAKKQ